VPAPARATASATGWSARSTYRFSDVQTGLPLRRRRRADRQPELRSPRAAARHARRVLATRARLRLRAYLARSSRRARRRQAGASNHVPRARRRAALPASSRRRARCRQAGRGSPELAPAARWTASAADVICASRSRSMLVVIAAPAARARRARDRRAHRRQARADREAGRPPARRRPPGRRRGRVRGTVAMVGHLMGFNPAVRRTARAVLRSGDLGRPFYVHAMAGQPRPDPQRRDRAVVLRSARLSMLDHILGEHPVTAPRHAAPAVLQPGIEDVVFVTLRYASGILDQPPSVVAAPPARSAGSPWCARRRCRARRRVAEKLRNLRKGLRPAARVHPSSGSSSPSATATSTSPRSAEEPLRVEIRHFLDLHRARRAPGDRPLAQGVRVTAVLEAAERSLAAGGAPLPGRARIDTVSLRKSTVGNLARDDTPLAPGRRLSRLPLRLRPRGTVEYTASPRRTTKRS